MPRWLSWIWKPVGEHLLNYLKDQRCPYCDCDTVWFGTNCPFKDRQCEDARFYCVLCDVDWFPNSGMTHR